MARCPKPNITERPSLRRTDNQRSVRPKFSANLGYLWTTLPLADAIRAAHVAGFDAVECHWPYDQPIRDIRSALLDTDLPMLGLNTRRGAPGEFGLAALPGRQTEARAAIDEAIEFADAIDAKAIHVMAGNTAHPAARAQFLENLRYAVAQTPRTILIEPLNRHDAPDYFLRTTAQASGIIAEVDAANLKLMFDCYHVGRTEGDVVSRLRSLLPSIGHIQFASVPDRRAPDRGSVNYSDVFSTLAELGWNNPLGAEYRPDGTTESSLGWMKHL